METRDILSKHLGRGNNLDEWSETACRFWENTGNHYLQAVLRVSPAEIISENVTSITYAAIYHNIYLFAYMKTVIVIPAYNEEENIRSLLASCQLLGYNNIIVVDDGSTDKTALIARGAGVVVVSHVINRGVGAATQTGLEAARIMGAEIAVTIDADGQHQAKDIKNIENALISFKRDIVIGSRFLHHENDIPRMRRIFNTIANIITFFLAGRYLTDTQSGLKAFSQTALECIQITANGFEFSSEIIREAQHFRLNIAEISASVVYTPYSLSKGQNLATGISTIFKLIIRALMR
jgi:UDP-N-acetylglucosamine---dolichyl-phosphate N-acetylglucosaminyltransferase